MFSVGDSDFPFGGMGGYLCCLRGTAIVCSVDVKTTCGVTDVKLWLDSKLDREYWDGQQVYVLSESQAVWLPFGSMHISHFLSKSRPTKVAAAVEAKSGKKRPRKDDSDGIRYGALCFVPVMSSEDVEAPGKTVAWSYSTLSRCQSRMPKRITQSPSYRDWMDKLKQVVDQQHGKEDAVPVASLLTPEGDNDDE